MYILTLFRMAFLHPVSFTKMQIVSTCPWTAAAISAVLPLYVHSKSEQDVTLVLCNTFSFVIPAYVVVSMYVQSITMKAAVTSVGVSGPKWSSCTRILQASDSPAIAAWCSAVSPFWNKAEVTTVHTVCAT